MAIKVLLMGAGQIGSRHLQGLKPFSQPLELTVVDPSKESLALAKERYEGFGGQVHHQVQYLTSLDQVSQSTFDVILVTTNSGVREAVLDQILHAKSCKYLILEKVLFSQKKAYQKFDDIFNQLNIQAFVNCPMRLQQCEREIFDVFQMASFDFALTGAEYGLACNSVHFADFLCWVAGETQFSVNFDPHAIEVFESKRPGYLELSGKIELEFSKNRKASFQHDRGLTAFAQYSIQNSDHRFEVLRNKNIYTYSTSKNLWQQQERKLVTLFQSQLSHSYLDKLLSGEELGLVNYSDSATIHEHLYFPLADFVNQSGKNSTPYEIPFT